MERFIYFININKLSFPLQDTIIGLQILNMVNVTDLGLIKGFITYNQTLSWMGH